MKTLTKKQLETLKYIYAFIAKNDRSPTWREIAEGVGVASTNAVHLRIQSLKSKGYLYYIPGKAKSIRVVFVPKEAA